jgi:hypothetical protein
MARKVAVAKANGILTFYIKKVSQILLLLIKQIKLSLNIIYPYIHKYMVMPLSFIEEITMIQTIYFFTYQNLIISNYYSISKYNKIDVIIIIIQ